MQVETLEEIRGRPAVPDSLPQGMHATVVNLINELKTYYEKRISELEIKFEQEKQEYQFKYLEIKERYDLLIYKRYVRSAEQMPADDKQPSLFEEEAEQAEVVEQEEQEETRTEELTEVCSYKRKKAGRKAIDPNIPREEKIIDIPESEKVCACGAELSRIGEETSERLHIVPPRIHVEKTIRPKYACRACEGTEDEYKPAVRMAPVEPSIIPRSIVSPSLLSHIIIHKYEDHLPFYRQEKQFERIGVTISRQDMASETSFPMATKGLSSPWAVI